jgi:hypothetical protein
VHHRWYCLFDGAVEEQNMVDIMQLVLAMEDGMPLGLGGHNGASGSECT